MKISIGTQYSKTDPFKMAVIKYDEDNKVFEVYMHSDATDLGEDVPTGVCETEEQAMAIADGWVNE